MKIINILLIILLIIAIYKVIQNCNNSKIEKFNNDTSCSASLTHWKKVTTQPDGTSLLGDEWEKLKYLIIINSKLKNELIFNYSINDTNFGKSDKKLYLPSELDYKININTNDYIKINIDGKTEFWHPSKNWKDGVVSYFCSELCLLKLGYEWIKIKNVDNLEDLSTKISEKEGESLRQLIINGIIGENNLYINLNKDDVDNLNIFRHINTESYISVDENLYKVAANEPLGKKWVKIDKTVGTWDDWTIIKKEVFGNDYNLSGKNIKILSDTEYNEIKSTTDKMEYIAIDMSDEVSYYYISKLFDYDMCYQKSCLQFAETKFDNYLNIINLRDSLGHKTSSFGHTTDLMYKTDKKILDLVENLQLTINHSEFTDKCSSNQIYNKIIELLKTNQYVRDDNNSSTCTKTYDPNAYVKRPYKDENTGRNFYYDDICNELDDNSDYKEKLNPYLYSYITSDDGWLTKDEAIEYNFEKNWENIKNNIDVTNIESLQTHLQNKVIARNQLTELLVKYLDDTEYYMHENFRKPNKSYGGKCAIIRDPNSGKLIDSKNIPLDESDVLNIYSDSNIYMYTWKKIDNIIMYDTPTEIVDDIIVRKLAGGEVIDGEVTFSTTAVSPETSTYIKNNFIIMHLYKFEQNGNPFYFQYLGLLPEYIKYGKNGKYIEITSNNLDKVDHDSYEYIKTSDCTSIIDEHIDKTQIKLNKITEDTNLYYNSILQDKKNKIEDKKNALEKLNYEIKASYDNICEKYNTNIYKLYTDYNIVKLKLLSSNDDVESKINLNELTQKTVKLINITDSAIDYCTDNKRCLGNIEGTYNILENNKNSDGSITLSINDFYRVVNKINILKNDVVLHGSITYKISDIYNHNIEDDINNDVKLNKYPQIFSYSYNDFINKNIDLHKIDIDKEYYINLDGSKYKYELIMDNTFKHFINNYKSVYESINSITLTNTEKCINNADEEIFAERDSIHKDNNPCRDPLNNTCKEKKFTKNYTSEMYGLLDNLTINKDTWVENNLLKQYDDAYKLSTTGAPESILDNTHANYWKNKYGNETSCPPDDENKPIIENGLYYVNPNYNNGLKWRKIEVNPPANISSKLIIEIYDVNILYNQSIIGSEIIDFTHDQNNIIFIDAEKNYVSMDNITPNHYLKIRDKNKNKDIYYQIYGNNKCSNSQVCSEKSNQEYARELNAEIIKIYEDQIYCNNLNTEYLSIYGNELQNTPFIEENLDISKSDISEIFKSLDYYPIYDNNFQLATP